VRLNIRAEGIDIDVSIRTLRHALRAKKAREGYNKFLFFPTGKQFKIIELKGNQPSFRSTEESLILLRKMYLLIQLFKG
jgi:hypothetical protein